MQRSIDRFGNFKFEPLFKRAAKLLSG